MKLIDKDKIVTEIKRRVEAIRKAFNEPGILSGVDRTYANAQYDAFKSLLTFLDTIETKEVDLEKEINDYISNNFFGSQTLGFFANRTKEEPNDQDIALCAKHFYELGIKAKKGE